MAAMAHDEAGIVAAAQGSPCRVRLSRRKGYKLPPDTVNVSRPGKWGNPFIVGKHGTREECVRLFRLLAGGYLCISHGFECADAQQRFLKHAKKHIASLRGKNLACWCRLDGKPCHGDVLLEAANAATSPANRKRKRKQRRHHGSNGA